VINIGSKYNIDSVKALFKENNLILDTDKYINNHTKMPCHDKDGYKYEVSVNSVVNSKTPQKFSKYNRFSIDNIQLMLDKDNCNTKIIEEEYVNSRTKMRFICSCGTEFKADLLQLVSDGKRYCNYCAKSKRYDGNDYYEIALNKCKDNNCQLLSKTIIRTNHIVKYICNKHLDKGVQSNLFHVFINNKFVCKYCAIENMGKLHRTSKEDIIALLDEKGFDYVDHDYIKETPKSSSRVRIHCICRSHRDKGVQYISLTNLKTNKCGCVYCIGRGRTKESLQEECNEMNNNLTVVEFNSYTNIMMKCNHCGYIWKTNGVNITQGHGCPKCCKSKGEQKIETILKNNAIKYKPQYSENGCRDILPLPFDFYLYDLNIMIEVDGKQHYEPICFGGISIEEAQENFKIVQKHDSIKTAYCKNNGIRLLRIPYFIIEDKTIDLENYLLNLINNYTH